MVHQLIKLLENSKELFQSSIKVPNYNDHIVNLPKTGTTNTINNTGKTTKVPFNNIQQSTNAACNSNLDTKIPMNNHEITTNNNIKLPVNINETNNNNADSIDVNNNYSDLTDQSLNNVIEFRNYKPPTLYQFSTSNNKSVNLTNKRRNITLNIRHEHETESITRRLLSKIWYLINDIRLFVFQYNR